MGENRKIVQNIQSKLLTKNNDYKIRLRNKNISNLHPHSLNVVPGEGASISNLGKGKGPNGADDLEDTVGPDQAHFHQSSSTCFMVIKTIRHKDVLINNVVRLQQNFILQHKNSKCQKYRSFTRSQVSSRVCLNFNIHCPFLNRRSRSWTL